VDRRRHDVTRGEDVEALEEAVSGLQTPDSIGFETTLFDDLLMDK